MSFWFDILSLLKEGERYTVTTKPVRVDDNHFKGFITVTYPQHYLQRYTETTLLLYGGNGYVEVPLTNVAEVIMVSTFTK